MRIVAHVFERFALNLSPADVLKESTIAALARMIDAPRAVTRGRSSRVP